MGRTAMIGARAVPSGRVGTLGATRGGDRVWEGAQWSDDDMVAVRRRGFTSTSRTVPRRAVDQRGAFVALFSGFLLVACFLPYYRVIAIGGVTLAKPATFTAIDAVFGGWRVVLPLAAAATVLLGVTTSVLRVGSRGAASVLTVLRLVALVQLVLWVLVAVDRQVQGTSPAARALGADPAIALTWVALATIAGAAIALAGSFASMTNTPGN